MQSLGILLTVLAVLTVACVVLVSILVVRTSRTRRAVSATGIKSPGLTASYSLSLETTETQLLEWVKEVVQSNPRYSGLEQDRKCISFRIRPNIWVWGEDISVAPGQQESHNILRINVSCRPHIRTTIYEYGQCGKDLAQFLIYLYEKAGREPFTAYPPPGTREGR